MMSPVLAMMFPWVTITARGMPVEPEVNMSAARSVASSTATAATGAAGSGQVVVCAAAWRAAASGVSSTTAAPSGSRLPNCRR